ncbi:VanZ family protein [Silanimonas sp.]|uniref:VanZ family protein n=1 Tax=Silanimonas sp. TaxID=1929290 RepID=UPI0037C6092F
MSGGAVAPVDGLRWRGAWLALWAFGWVLCLVLSLGPPVPGAAPMFPHADKLNHALAYAALAWWAMGCFASTAGRRRALLALLVLGAAMEWAQGAFTVDRQRDGLDLVANAVGVGLGTALGLALNLPAWLEARFRR